MLKISGFPYAAIASSTASVHNAVSIEMDKHHASRPYASVERQARQVDRDRLTAAIEGIWRAEWLADIDSSTVGPLRRITQGIPEIREGRQPGRSD